MDSSVTARDPTFVATIMAIRTDLRFGLAESGGWADSYVGVASAVGEDETVENKPRHSSGHTVRR